MFFWLTTILDPLLLLSACTRVCRAFRPHRARDRETSPPTLVQTRQKNGERLIFAENILCRNAFFVELRAAIRWRNRTCAAHCVAFRLRWWIRTGESASSAAKSRKRSNTFKITFSSTPIFRNTAAAFAKESRTASSLPRSENKCTRWVLNLRTFTCTRMPEKFAQTYLLLETFKKN